MKKILLIIYILLLFQLLFAEIIENDFEDYLVKAIENTHSNIIIFDNILSSEKILNTIIDIKKKNIDILVSLNNKNFTKAYSLHEELVNNNITLFTHTFDFNFILIDDSIVYSGNFLLSKDKYQNNGIIIKSINKNYANELKKIISKSEKYLYTQDTINCKQLLKAQDKYINKNIVVKCKIIEIKKSHKSNTFILYSDKNKNNFKIIIFPDLYREFEKKNINPLYMLNKEIIVKGYFFKHNKYGYEIILKSIKDINWK